MARLSPPDPLDGGWEGEKMVEGMVDLNTLAQIHKFHRTHGDWSNLEIVFYKAGV